MTINSSQRQEMIKRGTETRTRLVSGFEPAWFETRYPKVPARKVIESIAQVLLAARPAVDTPEVRHNYDQFKTLIANQYLAVVEAGLVIEVWPEYKWSTPYNAQLFGADHQRQAAGSEWAPLSSPMFDDLDSGHLYFFPTEGGFGGEGAEEIATHPLLAESPLVSTDGYPMLYNDLFRVVHDVFGHWFNRCTFGIQGELGATMAHAATMNQPAILALLAEAWPQNCVWYVTGDYADQKYFHTGLVNNILCSKSNDWRELYMSRPR